VVTLKRRPALFGTTHEFLSYFNLRSLSELPELIHERQFEEIAKEMNMEIPFEEHSDNEGSEADITEVQAVEEAHTAEVIPISDAMRERDNDNLDTPDIEEVDHESDQPE